MTPPDDMTTAAATAAPKRSRKSLWLFLSLLGAGLAIGGTLRAVASDDNAKTLPDLVGKSQPAVPAGALHVKRQPAWSMAIRALRHW